MPFYNMNDVKYKLETFAVLLSMLIYKLDIAQRIQLSLTKLLRLEVHKCPGKHPNMKINSFSSWNLLVGTLEERTLSIWFQAFLNAFIFFLRSFWSSEQTSVGLLRYVKHLITLNFPHLCPPNS